MKEVFLSSSPSFSSYFLFIYIISMLGCTALLNHVLTFCQVHEMETFLAEYGLVWVGEPGNEQSDVYLEDDVDDDEEEEENSILTETSLTSDSPVISVASSNPFGVWRQDASLPAPSQPLNLDFNQLVENIKDLNVLAGEGVAQIRKTAEGARFEIPDPVQLTIYANGILMFDGPFRPYTELSTRQCVQDLMDGYFPSELQSRYKKSVDFFSLKVYICS